jgi:hypothetical protein
VEISPSAVAPEFRKADLVVLRSTITREHRDVSGEARPQVVRMARTLVVGYDLLARDELAARQVLDRLNAALGAAHAGALAGEIDSPARSAGALPGTAPLDRPARVGLRLVDLASPAGSEARSTDPLLEGALWYLEARSTSSPAVALGETIRVGLRESEPICGVPMRLWL